MELKQARPLDLHRRSISLNRTFMELKLKMGANTKYSATGLNRTFMELKHGKNLDLNLPSPVLIEPLWN